MRLIDNIANRLTAKKAFRTTLAMCVAIHRRTGIEVGYFNAIIEGGYIASKTTMVHKTLASAADDNLYGNVLSGHFITECDIFKVYEYDEYEHKG